MAAQAETMEHATEQAGIERFLENDHAKTLLRFTTCGSVDDGKSTLIGRLLYDSHNVYEDQVRSIAKFSASRGEKNMDLSLLTDGLRAEREQGITIDVAYRYFSTAKRKFIIADTPGHEQYTRNMATGASTAVLAGLLVDARKGVLEQSRRHAYIASLLGISRILVAVNKMDLVGYDQRTFESIRREFGEILEKLGCPGSAFLPLSALTGDNVVSRTAAMPWFQGPSLLEYLETVEIESGRASPAFRMAVQYVLRPHQEFRGYAGQIASGSIRPGDEVTVLPSGRRSRVRRIAGFGADLDAAHAPMSVTLTLENEIDLSRGDMLAARHQLPQVGRTFDADVVWMSVMALDPARPLLLKHTTQTVRAQIREVAGRVDLHTLGTEPAYTLGFNDIGRLRIEASRPLFFDPYRVNRCTGSFILIDPATHATVGAGMILESVEQEGRLKGEPPEKRELTEPVTAAERLARYRHFGAVVRYGDSLETGQALERRLFEEGCAVILLREGAGTLADTLERQGFLVLEPGDPGIALPRGDREAADVLHARLSRQGVFARAPGEEDRPQ